MGANESSHNNTLIQNEEVFNNQSIQLPQTLKEKILECKQNNPDLFKKLTEEYEQHQDKSPQALEQHFSYFINDKSTQKDKRVQSNDIVEAKKRVAPHKIKYGSTPRKDSRQFVLRHNPQEESKFSYEPVTQSQHQHQTQSQQLQSSPINNSVAKQQSQSVFNSKDMSRSNSTITLEDLIKNKNKRQQYISLFEAKNYQNNSKSGKGKNDNNQKKLPPQKVQQLTDRLFHEKDELKKKKNQLSQQYKEKELQTCTFQPKISPSNHVILQSLGPDSILFESNPSSQKINKSKIDQFLDNQKMYEQKTSMKKKLIKFQQDEKEREELTHHPHVSEASNKIIKESLRKQQKISSLKVELDPQEQSHSNQKKFDKSDQIFEDLMNNMDKNNHHLLHQKQQNSHYNNVFEKLSDYNKNKTPVAFHSSLRPSRNSSPADQSQQQIRRSACTTPGKKILKDKSNSEYSSAFNANPLLRFKSPQYQQQEKSFSKKSPNQNLFQYNNNPEQNYPSYQDQQSQNSPRNKSNQSHHSPYQEQINQQEQVDQISPRQNFQKQKDHKHIIPNSHHISPKNQSPQLSPKYLSHNQISPTNMSHVNTSPKNINHISPIIDIQQPDFKIEKFQQPSPKQQSIYTFPVYEQLPPQQQEVQQPQPDKYRKSSNNNTSSKQNSPNHSNSTFHSNTQNNLLNSQNRSKTPSIQSQNNNQLQQHSPSSSPKQVQQQGVQNSYYLQSDNQNNQKLNTQEIKRLYQSTDTVSSRNKQNLKYFENQNQTNSSIMQKSQKVLSQNHLTEKDFVQFIQDFINQLLNINQSYSIEFFDQGLTLKEMINTVCNLNFARDYHELKKQNQLTLENQQRHQAQTYLISEMWSLLKVKMNGQELVSPRNLLYFFLFLLKSDKSIPPAHYPYDENIIMRITTPQQQQQPNQQIQFDQAGNIHFGETAKPELHNKYKPLYIQKLHSLKFDNNVVGNNGGNNSLNNSKHSVSNSINKSMNNSSFLRNSGDLMNFYNPNTSINNPQNFSSPQKTKQLSQNYKNNLLKKSAQNDIKFNPRDSYSRQKASQNIRDKKLKKQRQEQQEQELQNCTFTPQINHSDFQLKRPQSVHDTLYKQGKPSNQKRDRTNNEIDYEKNCDECSFQPKLSHVQNIQPIKKQNNKHPFVKELPIFKINNNVYSRDNYTLSPPSSSSRSRPKSSNRYKNSQEDLYQQYLQQQSKPNQVYNSQHCNPSFKPTNHIYQADEIYTSSPKKELTIVDEEKEQCLTTQENNNQFNQYQTFYSASKNRLSKVQ